MGGQAQRLVKEISLGLKFWNQLIKMLNAVRKTLRLEFYFLKVSWFKWVPTLGLSIINFKGSILVLDNYTCNCNCQKIGNANSKIRTRGW